jgi:hypothetical protein
MLYVASPVLKDMAFRCLRIVGAFRARPQVLTSPIARRPHAAYNSSRNARELAVRPIRVYADTSVFGGVFDDLFAQPSRTFFDQVREGAVNSTQGYGEIAIHSPQEVVHYE